nr:hypothetical protein [Tanacetum cinerariifolium]
MAAPGPSNVVARRVVDDLIEFSDETVVPKFMKDDMRDENLKLLELNDVIVEAEERIATKEAYVEIMKAGGDGV